MALQHCSRSLITTELRVVLDLHPDHIIKAINFIVLLSEHPAQGKMKEHIRRGINDDVFGNGKIKLEITG